MPNGRSGGFQIAKGSLEQLLATSGEPSLVIGQTPYRADVTIADAVRMLQEFASERVWIEEHDYAFYIMHLDWPVEAPDDSIAEKWVLVFPRSPLFDGLRHDHRSGSKAPEAAGSGGRSAGQR